MHRLFKLKHPKYNIIFPQTKSKKIIDFLLKLNYDVTYLDTATKRCVSIYSVSSPERGHNNLYLYILNSNRFKIGKIKDFKRYNIKSVQLIGVYVNK